MDPITIGVGLTILVSASMAILIKQYRSSLKSADAEKEELLFILGHSLAEKEELLATLEQAERGYVEEDCDYNMRLKCQELLKCFCPNGVKEKFEEFETVEKRKLFVQELVDNVKQIMQVEITQVVICEMPMENRGGYVYNDEKNCIHKALFLNELYLIEDPERAIETVFHELKHGVQNEAIFEKDKWGYSAQRKAQWLNCMNNNYVRGNYSFEAYSLQAIEIDARLFGIAVINDHK